MKFHDVSAVSETDHTTDLAFADFEYNKFQKEFQEEVWRYINMTRQAKNVQPLVWKNEMLPRAQMIAKTLYMSYFDMESVNASLAGSGVFSNWSGRPFSSKDLAQIWIDDGDILPRLIRPDFSVGVIAIYGTNEDISIAFLYGLSEISTKRSGEDGTESELSSVRRSQCDSYTSTQ